MCNRPFVYANHLNCNASFTRKILHVFITGRQRSCGKVMFLHLFVCPLGEGRCHLLSGPMSFLGEGVCLQRGYWPSGTFWHICQKATYARRPVAEGPPPPPRQADTAVGSMHPTGMHSCFHCTSTFRTPQMHSQARSIDMFCYVSLLWTKITYKVYLVQSSRIIIFRQKINFCF